MESLLDRLRRHELQPIPQMVDVLLESADASRSLLARHQAGGQGEAVSTTSLVRRISELAAGLVPSDAPALARPSPPPRQLRSSRCSTSACTQGECRPGVAGQARQLEIQIGPLERPGAGGRHQGAVPRHSLASGAIRDITKAPNPIRASLRWRPLPPMTTLLDLFAFHVSKDQVLIP